MINYKSEIRKLQNRILRKKIIIGIIGLGYVGLPLAILFAKKRFKIYGFDNNKKKVNLLKRSITTVDTISSNKVKKSKNYITYLDNFKKIKDCDVIFICLPTPLNKGQKPDLKYIKDGVKQIYKNSKPYQTVILESTSYPGTTEEFLVNKFKKKYNIGKNYFIGFSSERIDPGNNDNNISHVPKVISGKTLNCGKIINNIYSKVFKKIVKTKEIKIAEFSKLLENIYRSVNIGFINEMKIVADNMGIDIFDVINAASTKPFGFKRFDAGPGIGGHCIPIDPQYLYWKSKKDGYEPKFIKLSADINIAIKKFIFKKIINYSIKNKKFKKINILILGLSYKKNIKDLRESAAIELIKLLKKRKYKNIFYSDPKVDPQYLKQETKIILKRIDISRKSLRKIDLTVLITDHEKFNYKNIYKYSKYIIDCRGKYKVSKKVERA